MTVLVVILCSILALVTLLYIFFEEAPEVERRRDRWAVLMEKKEQLLDNLRDLRFEYRAGKLSEADYERARATLEAEIAAVLAELEKLSSEDAARVAPQR
ncbi:MAG: hypothetical protein N0A16_06850 [Blastocatellia bacterium]|nr:hypothetical protein [Blastocatellia bacterium]MCS7157428.1 hypothetical protein [Blastocatellia bacterium]MCX7752602.1 hypothetical protein [Blastocatellia bacterium]MDW8168333.1 hypothetical protein [Acidobacteriota bacterium]MDW8255529.1 hypothetical protein [Acidobacteriota bacterium]